MNLNDVATIVAFIFAIHCVFVYAIVKLLVTGKPVWFAQKDPRDREDRP